MDDINAQLRLCATAEELLREINAEIKRLALMKRSIHKGFEFNLSVSYLKEIYDRYGDVCPACDQPFVRRPKAKTKERVPSVDRIDATLGYVIGNIQILCKSCNEKKSREFKAYEPVNRRIHPAVDGLIAYPELIDDLKEKEND